MLRSEPYFELKSAHDSGETNVSFRALSMSGVLCVLLRQEAQFRRLFARKALTCLSMTFFSVDAIVVLCEEMLGLDQEANSRKQTKTRVSRRSHKFVGLPCAAYLRSKIGSLGESSSRHSTRSYEVREAWYRPSRAQVQCARRQLKKQTVTRASFNERDKISLLTSTLPAGLA